MSAMITNIIGNLILNISMLSITKTLVKDEENLFKVKNIILILLLSILQAVFYDTQYNMMYIITNFLAITLFNKLVFRKNMTRTLICTILVFFLLMLSDLLGSMIMVNLVSFEKVRKIWYLKIFCNLIVAVLCYGLFSIPIIKKKCKYFITKFQDKQIPIIVLFLILLISIVVITYNISVTFKWNADYLGSIFVIITLMIFCYIFINENNQLNQLNDEYDSLFQCIQTFEDWIEKEQLNRHEYKNQLAVLRCLTKEKKVKEKIDSIILDNININTKTVNQLSSIPNGGLKGLLYYKIIIAQNHQLNIEIDANISFPDYIKTIPEHKMKILCRLLGIYLDNAIEASIETKKKVISIEIYELDQELNIVISNTFNPKHDIKRRNEKGYTTKGKGHGMGLYFAKKMLDKNEWLKEIQEIKRDLYTQKLILKKKH